MSSVCRTKPSCPAPSTGYNICIHNRNEFDQLYHFGTVDDTGNAFDTPDTQTVTVPRNSSICYKITSPIGEPVVLRTGIAPSATIWGVFACSVTITSRVVINEDLEVMVLHTLDCSPCPCDCEFSCAPEKSSCESVSGPGFGLGFGLSKKLAKLCSDNPYETTSDTGGWIFSGN